VSVNPICTPARTALLTGKYTHQIGTLSMSGDLSLEHPTYLRALQEAGYWTAGVGKFHWNQNWPWGTPRGKGHDLVAIRNEVRKYGLDYIWEVSGKQLAVRNNCDYGEYLRARGILEPYRDHIESRGPNSRNPEQTRWTGAPWPFAEEDYVDIVTGREIIRSIDKRPVDKPFFILGSFCGPHQPYDPPASFLDAAAEEGDIEYIPGETEMAPETRERLREVRRAYKAMIMCIDQQVGLILDKLEHEGLLDSTVIVFTSDHGEMLGDHNCMAKMLPWRESVVVPAAIRHPEHLLAQTCDSPIEITDLTATILDVAGLAPQQALSKPWPAFHDRVPCRSLMPILRGQTESIRDYVFSECAGNWQMVQNRQWKYIRHLNRSPEADFREELYNLENDPQERRNVIGESAWRAVLDELRAPRIQLMDATPPAQTGWASYNTPGAEK
jgi:choline-sulfatase